MRRALVILVVALFGFCAVAFSDTVYLKSGGKVTGKITEQNDDKVKVETSISVMTVERKNIDRIEIDKVEEKAEEVKPEVKVEAKESVPVAEQPAAGGTKTAEKVESPVRTETSELPRPTEEASDNAATYYLKAIKAMVYPESKETRDNILAVIQIGWRLENKDLEELLNQNEACLEELEKALSIEKCDFDFGKKYEYEISRPSPPLAEMCNLNRLLLLRGRYDEKVGQISNALDSYLDSLASACHIAQYKSVISQLVVYDIIHKSYNPLNDYMRSENCSKEMLERIYRCLNDYESKLFLPAEAWTSERDYIFSTFRMPIDGIKKGIMANSTIDDVSKRRMEAFADEFVLQARGLWNRYYGNYIKAAKSGSEEDRKFARSEREGLRRTRMAYNNMNLENLGESIRELLVESSEYSEANAEKIIVVWLSELFADIDKFFDKCDKALMKFRELESLAQKKAGFTQ